MTAGPDANTLQQGRREERFPSTRILGGAGSCAGRVDCGFPGQAASSFGSLARLQAAIVSVKRARPRSLPRYGSVPSRRRSWPSRRVPRSSFGIAGIWHIRDVGRDVGWFDGRWLNGGTSARHAASPPSGGVRRRSRRCRSRGRLPRSDVVWILVSGDEACRWRHGVRPVHPPV